MSNLHGCNEGISGSAQADDWGNMDGQCLAYFSSVSSLEGTAFWGTVVGDTLRGIKRVYHKGRTTTQQEHSEGTHGKEGRALDSSVSSADDGLFGSLGEIVVNRGKRSRENLQGRKASVCPVSWPEGESRTERLQQRGTGALKESAISK